MLVTHLFLSFPSGKIGNLPLLQVYYKYKYERYKATEHEKIFEHDNNSKNYPKIKLSMKKK